MNELCKNCGVCCLEAEIECHTPKEEKMIVSRNNKPMIHRGYGDEKGKVWVGIPQCNYQNTDGTCSEHDNPDRPWGCRVGIQPGDPNCLWARKCYGIQTPELIEEP